MSRQTVEIIINFFLQVVMWTVSAIPSASGSLCYFLYLFYRQLGQEQSTNRSTQAQVMDPNENFEQVRKFWCSIKSCQFDPDDDRVNDDNSEKEDEVDILPEEPPPPGVRRRHVVMRNNCLSASSLFEAANQAAKERDEKRLEEEKKQIMDFILIPLEFVTGLIGLKGSHIKEIETVTDTRISIKVENNNENGENGERLCVIKGKSENVVMAQGLIRDYIASNPVSTVKKFYVPKSFVGRIIGRKGETRRRIQECAKVKFNVEPGKQKNGINSQNTVVVDEEQQDETNKSEFNPEHEGPLACIVIKGTADQIACAEKMMLDIVQEAKDHRRAKEEEKMALNLGQTNNHFNYNPSAITTFPTSTNGGYPSRPFHHHNPSNKTGNSTYKWTASKDGTTTTTTGAVQAKDQFHWHKSNNHM